MDETTCSWPLEPTFLALPYFFGSTLFRTGNLWKRNHASSLLFSVISFDSLFSEWPFDSRNRLHSEPFSSSGISLASWVATTTFPLQAAHHSNIHTLPMLQLKYGALSHDDEGPSIFHKIVSVKLKCVTFCHLLLYYIDAHKWFIKSAKICQILNHFLIARTIYFNSARSKSARVKTVWLNRCFKIVG